MRKAVVLFAVLIVLLSNAFSASLMVVDMSSSIYDEMEDLYILEGKASPMGAKPWTETDVQHLLDRINPITDMGKQLKSKIQNELSEIKNEMAFKLSASLEPQLLLHTNSDDFDTYDDIWTSKELDTSLMNLGLGFSYSNKLALFMNISLGREIGDISNIKIAGSTKKITETLVNSDSYSTFSSNLPIVSGPFDFMNFPNRAYAVFGYDSFRVFAGKDRMEWGNGVMGNMLLGDTLPYHNMLSLTFTGSKWFHYQMLMDFYTPFKNLYGVTDDRVTLSGIRFLLGHRFEFSLLSGKLIMALTDSIMYESDDMYIDPQVLNPMAFLHNGYIAGHSNSFAALELEYSPMQNLSIYGQLGVDDIAMPSEPQPPEDGSTANGIGIMGGLRFRTPFEKGYLHGNLEVVYTTPFIYHRATGEGDAGGYDFYFVSSTRYKSNDSVSGIYRYLSFPFGSDAIAGLLSVGYKRPGLFDVTGNMFVMAHGVIDKFSVTSWYGSTTSDDVTHTPSKKNPFNTDETGEVEYTFAFGGDATYTPLSYLDLNMGLYFITKANLNNNADVNAFDLQLSFGVKLHY